MATTLAAHLRATFQRLSEQAAGSSDQAPITLQRAWNAVFFGSFDPDIRFYDALSTINQGLLRLSYQVTHCPEFDDQAREQGRRVIAGLSECLKPEHLQNPVHRHKSVIAEDRLGIMGMMASALRRAFPEPSLQKEVIELLAKEIRELLKQVQDADIDRDLQYSLIFQINILLWTLENSAGADFRAVQAAIGQLAITSRDYLHPVEGAKPDTVTIKKRIATALGKVFAALKIAKDIDDGLMAIELSKSM